jgi:MFS family permease
VFGGFFNCWFHVFHCNSVGLHYNRNPLRAQLAGGTAGRCHEAVCADVKRGLESGLTTFFVCANMSDSRVASPALIPFINLGHVLDHLLMLVYPTVILAMTSEFGMSFSEMLPLSIGGFIAFGAGSLPAGWLADRWSRHHMMLVFFFGIGAATMLTGLAQTPTQIAIGLTAMGLFASIYHPVGISMLVAGREKVGKLLGVNGVYGNLGVGFAAITAGALAEWVGWRSAFFIPGAVAIVTGIAFALLVPPPAARPVAAVAKARNSVPRDIMIRVFIVLTVATICNGVIYNAATISMPKMFEERVANLTGSTAGIGALVSMVYLAAACAQYVVGHLIDRFSLRMVFLPLAAMQIPLLLLAGSMDNYGILLVAVPMMFFIFGVIPINDAMVAKYTDEHWRSRVYAVRFVVSFSASACAVPLVAGLYKSSGGFGQVYIVLALFAVACSTAAWFFPQARQPAAVAESA